MMFNDRRVQLPNVYPAIQKFGTDLPGGTHKRDWEDWNARANVLAAARAGSIKATKKPRKGK